MPKRTPLDWEDLERELHTAGFSPEEIDAGARQLLAQARGHQLAETRKQLGLGQKQIAAAMGVSVARISPRSSTAKLPPLRSSLVTSRLSGDGWTSWPTSATGPSGCPSATPRPPHDSNRVTALPWHGQADPALIAAAPSHQELRTGQPGHGPCACPHRRSTQVSVRRGFQFARDGLRPGAERLDRGVARNSCGGRFRCPVSGVVLRWVCLTAWRPPATRRLAGERQRDRRWPRARSCQRRPLQRRRLSGAGGWRSRRRSRWRGRRPGGRCGSQPGCWPPRHTPKPVLPGAERPAGPGWEGAPGWPGLRRAAR
jgi:hypothetical protein